VPATATARTLAAAGHAVTLLYVAVDDSVLPLESRYSTRTSHVTAVAACV
jgi:hypothetical protein